MSNPSCRLARKRPFPSSIAGALVVAITVLLLPADLAIAVDDGRREFVVFDATLYKNKPDLTKYGLRQLPIIYGSRFWPKGESIEPLPSESRVRELAREFGGNRGPVVIDIEHWPLRGEEHVVSESLRRYIQIVQWFRQEAPGVAVGYYGAPPLRDYWRAVRGPRSRDYVEWQTENRRLHELADSVDVIFPSLYTFYPDRGGWVKYAIEQIREARRYGKPVYVFLWPQYHDSNRLLGQRYIPASFWAEQLETARAHADGVVIWGGWGEKGPAEWDESAAWWQVTKTFLAGLKN